MSDIPGFVGLELRTRRTGEVVDVAVRLTGRILVKVAPLLMLVELPFAAVVALIASSNDESGAEAYGMGALAVVLAFLPAAGTITALLVHAAHDAYLGRPISVKRSALRGLRRLPFVMIYGIVGWIAYSFVGTAVAIGSGAMFLPLQLLTRILSVFGEQVAAVAAGFIAIALLVVWTALQLGLYARFLAGLVSVIVERKGPFAGVGRGWRLTRKVWVRYGFLLVAALLLSAFVFFVFVLLTSWLGGTGRGAVSAAIGSALFYVLFGLVAFPFWASLSVAIYVDGRVRNEAFDLEHRFEEHWAPRAAAPVGRSRETAA